jgi:protein-disulfide isomerase
MRHRMTYLVSLLVALGGAALLAAFRASGASPAPADGQMDPLLAQRTKGDPKAAITVYELSDFQCPYCRRLAVETFPLIENEFIATGKVRWIFLNLPIISIHPNAVPAAEFAMCAARINRFWPVHDLIFRYQDKWAPLKDPAPFLLSLADSAGIPRADLLPCLERHDTRDLIQAESEGAAKSGVASTPTIYVEGAGLIPGAQPIGVYRQVFDSLWKERTGN